MSTFSAEADRRRYRIRKATERLNTIGIMLCTAVTVFFLFAILGYVAYHGASAIDWKFLTALPLPPGEAGGGIANALVGSALVVAAATLMAMPIGMGAAIFINDSLRRRNEQARLTTDFLRRELARAEAELNEAMAKVTEFTRENRGELPSDMTTHLNRLERLNAERKSLIAQISDVEERIDELQARREAVILDACKGKGFTLDKLKKAYKDAAKVS